MHFSFADGQWDSGGSVVNANGLLEDNEPPILASPIEQADRRDGHWRSFNVLTGYRVHALDGEAGYVQDPLIDCRTPAVPALVIDTSCWWTGHCVFIAPHWVTDVRSTDRVCPCPSRAKQSNGRYRMNFTVGASPLHRSMIRAVHRSKTRFGGVPGYLPRRLQKFSSINPGYRRCRC